MRRVLAVLLPGILAVVIQGAAAVRLPLAWVPDFGLLFPVAAALVLGSSEGLVVAAAIGLGADVLSGSLLGQQACLRLLAFASTRLIGGQLDLRRPLPLAVFVAVLSAADAAGMAALTWLFLGELAFSPAELAGFLQRAVVNGAAAPLVAAGVRALVVRLDEADARREMRIDTARPSL